MVVHLAAGAAACGAGGLIGLLNYRLGRKVLLTAPDRYAIASLVKQVMNIALLVICYVVGVRTPLSVAALLVGVVVGITISTVWFTMLLLKVNRELGKADRDTEEGKSNG